MLHFTETFIPAFHPIDDKSKYFPLSFAKYPGNLYNSGSFLSTDCSSLSSIDGMVSSNNSEKDSPIGKNVADQTNYRVKYKTEICKYWRERGVCEFADNCAFAHGYDEIREKVHVPSNYKTKKCRKFHENGFCPYGSRCQFLHLSNQKIQIKSQRISLTKVNSYADFINNVQDFWNKDEKIFFWLYQCRTRLEIFEKISSPKVEKKEKKVMEISDIIFQKND